MTQEQFDKAKSIKEKIALIEKDNDIVQEIFNKYKTDKEVSDVCKIANEALQGLKWVYENRFSEL